MNVTPAVLLWARKSAGLDLGEVAHRLQVDPGVLAAWEDGTDRPSLTHAERLAVIYKRPLVAFFLSEPPAEPALPRDFRTMPDRAGGQLSPETLLAVRRARRVQAQTIELRKALRTEQTIRLAHVSARLDDDSAAAAIRRNVGVEALTPRAWRDMYEALRSWRSAVERLGVLVLQFAMPVSDARGFTLPSDSVPVVVLNTRDSPSARMFSLFHELAHLALGHAGMCDMEVYARGDVGSVSIERRCNKIAGAFLVPKADLLAHERVESADGTGVWQDDDLKVIAWSFKVSREVVLRRLLDLGLTFPRFYAQKRAEWQRAAADAVLHASGGGPAPSVRCVSEYGRSFVSLVLESVDAGQVPYADVPNYLGLKLSHLAEVSDMVATDA
jgi:Zn-dependent peptidase ImmA (M78 family)/transcriptional regulator with XRE-family HTH domain